MPKFINASIDSKSKPCKTVFTYRMTSDDGWTQVNVRQPDAFEHIVYLGFCKIDGDMFAAHDEGTIEIYKGTKGSEFNQ